MTFFEIQIDLLIVLLILVPGSEKEKEFIDYLKKICEF